MKKQFLTLAIIAACLAGTQAYAFSIRIIGGEEAQPAAYPWMVSLRHDGGGQFCGASLVAPDWVMTAAHCVESENAQGIEAVIGDLDLNQTDQGELTRQINRIVVHPDRSASSDDHDIALLELSSGANLQAVAPATPTITNNISAGTPLTVMGWGNMSTSGEEFPNRLQEVQVPLVAQDECRHNYGGSITDNMICAGLPQGGKDSCQGDSGGPLVHQIDGDWHQVGIVSWGEGCAQPGYPGVYARVGAYSDWITQVTSGDSTGGDDGDPSPGEPDAPIDIEDPVSWEDPGYLQAFDLPYWFDFYTFENEPVEESIEFYNNTETLVSITAISIDQEAFNLSGNGCEQSVNPEQSCEFSVTYTPTPDNEIDMALLSLSVSDGSQLYIELFGENLTLLEGLDDEFGDWYGSDSDWMFYEDDDSFVLNCWDIDEGDIANLETEFEGPGFLQFDFSLSDENESNRLIYLVDGKPVRTLDGNERNPGKHQTELSAGKHRVSWVYQKKAPSSGQAKISNVKFQSTNADTGNGQTGGSNTSASGGGGAGDLLMLLSLLALGVFRRYIK
ncbi:MAG: serine protease [Candidatus Thiodiazotropha taylori]|uniref:Serine protease n=1 Tax=Candidatus Thiodiazotropha taylori TaxID=2792791 RepID=A0A9E4N8D2_9GAMM|nr:serine protease [Candidatus Thiodiazotropha taylori]MCG7955209.1 serine protease [Candidatus Thiodiazotropha taylori]MCG8026932.1 serine protease [Candidatus Thiodiazotropha taylori]MCG8042096.1 serine protease [Candidatus Thiodiazotropha taylori]MCG8049777.1 serine protease [Candidatus Thiodiazotropha taylori]